MAKGSGSTRGSGAASSSSRVTGSSSLKSFLLSYKPEDDMFTSKAEMDLIADKLKFSSLSAEQLRETRNKVVEIYSDAMEKEIQYDEDGKYAGRTEKYWDYNEGMMSVTAVIDNELFKRGREV